MMKKKITIAALTLCLLWLSSFAGCRTSHYSDDEVLEWARENIGPSVVLSGEYEERVNPEGYTELVWTAYTQERPDLEFEVVSTLDYLGEGLVYNIESSYRSVYGRHFFEEYTAGSSTRFAPDKDQLERSTLRLTGTFDDREGIAVLAGELAAINEYMADCGAAGCVSFYVTYNDPLALDRESDVNEYFHDADAAEVISALEAELAVYAADYRLAAEQFTADELTAAVEQTGRAFSLIRADGTAAVYPDLSLSRFGYGMSFGTLYEVLSREGFEPEGTAESFSFKGVDGAEYEFSYSFNDLPYDTTSGYYYLKDGAPVAMDYYFYNHFRSDLLEEMTGMSFEDLPQ